MRARIKYRRRKNLVATWKIRWLVDWVASLLARFPGRVLVRSNRGMMSGALVGWKLPGRKRFFFSREI